MVSNISQVRISDNTHVSNNNINPKVEIKLNFIDKVIDETDNYVSECTDGNDDGKLSFGEKLKSFASGVIQHFTDEFKNLRKLIKEHPKAVIIGTIACVAIGALAISTLGAPLVFAILGLASIVIGVKNIISDIKNITESIKMAENATTDKDAKQAYAQLGNDSADIAENAVMIYTGTRQLNNYTSVLTNSSNYTRIAEQSTDDVINGVDDVIERACNNNLTDEETDIFKDAIENVTNVTDKISPVIEGSQQQDKSSLSSILCFGLLGSNSINHFMKNEEKI